MQLGQRLLSITQAIARPCQRCTAPINEIISFLQGHKLFTVESLVNQSLSQLSKAV